MKSVLYIGIALLLGILIGVGLTFPGCESVSEQRVSWTRSTTYQIIYLKSALEYFRAGRNSFEQNTLPAINEGPEEVVAEIVFTDDLGTLIFSKEYGWVRNLNEQEYPVGPAGILDNTWEVYFSADLYVAESKLYVKILPNGNVSLWSENPDKWEIRKKE